MGYYLFLLASIAWYVLPAWIVPLAAKAGASGAFYLADLLVVRQQVRLMLLVLPPAWSVRWPGAISGPLELNHRILFSLFYAVLGWIGVRLVCSQYQDKATRGWWLGVYWAAAFLFMQTAAYLMTFFGVLPKG